MNKNIEYQKEIVPPLTKAEAIEEASRCLLCHDAPCSKRCPAGTNPASFIRSIRFDNVYGAAKTIREANVLGSVCARVCPYKNLCEKECRRGLIDSPIKIGQLQRFATDYEKSENLEILKPQKATKEKVAIIGSGPAGLSAAADLALKGYKVTIFEKNSVAGGVLSCGIVPARLSQEVVNNDIQHVKNLGVEIKLNSHLESSECIDDLKKDGYKAFIMAIGNTYPKGLDIKGRGAEGIFGAVDFLAKARQSRGNVDIGKNVVIIGGGDVALDSALTARLLGAETVTVLYRRRLQDMPASIEEIETARELNINFYTTFTPEEYLTENNRLTGIKAKGTYTDSEITLEADMVIEAIGQRPLDVKTIFSDITLEAGKIVVDSDNAKTNIEGVFAAGDIVNGGATVVDAVNEGKVAADGVDQYLSSLRHEKPAKLNILKSHGIPLDIDFCGVHCENPFFLSSSPVGSNYEMCSKALNTGWGGIVYKTVGKFIANECSPRFDNNRKEGTPFLGFKNMEQISDKPLEKNLEMMQKLKKDFPNKVLIASIMGSNDDEWTELAKLVTEIGADLIECNFSCPQMTSHEMGSDVGQSPDLVRQYSAAVKRGTHLPILAKMTPNIGNMEIPAIAAIEGGATGIAAINTIKSITSIDLDKYVPLPIVNGKSSISGYSGKAVKPIALRFIAEMAKHSRLANVPISGMGGIENWRDAVEFLSVGASNLQVTTAIMQYGYRIVEDLISGTGYFLESKGFSKLSDIVGITLKNIIPAEEIDRGFIVYPKIDMDKCVKCGRCHIACYDAGYQAIKWDEKECKPSVDDEKCVGCHLCVNVCPVNCIEAGEIKFKKGYKPHDVIL